METINLETRINAPTMRVFLLSLSVDLHKASTKQTDEEAIAGVTHGLMSDGDVVTWRARHFGLRLTHTSKITPYDPPHRFRDTMTHGAFHSFEHLHMFHSDSSGTLMRDELVFSSPLGPIGRAVDKVLLRSYLTRFLKERNQLIRTVAESEAWLSFIPEGLQEVCI